MKNDELKDSHTVLPVLVRMAHKNKYDRSWADLHGLPSKPITPRHICVLNKPNIVIRIGRSIVRIAKSAHLFLTTKYSWATSWHLAAR